MEFQDALNSAGQVFFSNARHRGPEKDPPDCEAETADGGRVGIEITELVDPSSVAAARAIQAYDAKDWRSDLIPTLGEILKKKDTPATVKDLPYSEYVHLIHTDEPWLEIATIRQSLAKHVFPATSLITRAYLLISYDPWEKGYPCIRLNIASK